MAEKVKIYTTGYCGFCRSAKALLSKRGVAFDEVDVTDDPDQRDWLMRETGRHTVPQIFVGNRAIGGFSELQALDSDGELDALLTPED